MNSHFLFIVFVLASFMLLINSQCGTCAAGTVCYTQINTPSGYVLNYTATTTYCANCMSNCNSCSSIQSCDQCASGYSYDGSVCTVGNLQLNPQSSPAPAAPFNIKWIIVIIGAIVGMTVVGTIFFYCLSKKRKNNLKIFEDQHSAKEEMINQVEIQTVRTK